MTTLDDLKQIEKLDKSDMSNFIIDLPVQIGKAHELSKKIKPPAWKNISNIVICGMGGSAIGGDVVKSMIEEQLSIPLIINRSWNLPHAVNKNSLVFLVSFSGNTQETLSCAKQAIRAKAKIIAITSGGSLEKTARSSNLLLFKFNYQGPPRAALGYLFMPILITLKKLNLISLSSWKIVSSINKLVEINKIFYPETSIEKNIAKHLAYFIFDHLPIIISPENLAGIARRFKTQMAENAKTFCFFETIPEIFHNSIESQLPWRMKDELVFLILNSISPLSLQSQSSEKKSITAFEKLLDKQNIRWEKIPYFSNNKFEHIVSLILLGDWISFYLSILNKIDPTPVKKIEWIKKQLK